MIQNVLEIDKIMAFLKSKSQCY